MDNKSELQISDIPVNTGRLGPSEVKIYSSRFPIAETSIPETGDILVLHPHTNKRKILLISLLVALSLVILTLIITLSIMLTRKKEEVITEEVEQLVASIKREVNEVSRYQEIKYSEVSIDLDNKQTGNKQTIYTDVLFNIYDTEDVTAPKSVIYYGIAVLINMTMESEGNSTFIGGFDIYNFTKEENMTGEEDTETMFPMINETNCTENITDGCEQNMLSIPLIKFSFYENGTLLRLYKPKVIDAFIWQTLTDSIRQFTPMLSKKLYNTTLRNLEEFESTLRGVSSNESNTNLNEISVNHGGFNGLELSDSNIKTSISTTINNTAGKISNVESNSQCQFKKSNTTLKDIEVSPNSALNDIDTFDKSNVVTSGFDSLVTKVNSTFALLYSRIELNTTELLKNLTRIMEYNPVSDEEFIEGNRLRHLLKFPYKEYKKDISAMPNEISIVRFLEMDSFNTPIDFSYSIFKYNLLGLQMALHVVVTASVETDTSTIALVLKIASFQLEILNTQMKTNITEKIIKAFQIIRQLASKLIGLGDESAFDFKNSKMGDMVLKGESLRDKLFNIFDVGKIFEDPMAILQSSIFDVVRVKLSSLTDSITNNVKKFDSVISSIQIEGKSIPDRVIGLLKSNTQSFFEYGKKAFDMFNEKILGFLTAIASKLVDVDEIGNDIYVGTQAALQKVIDLYDSHVGNMLSGTVNAVENVITKFTDKLKSTIGKIIDGILTLLSKNPFVTALTTEESRNNLIASIKSIQATILKQTEAVLSLIRINDNALPNHEITKDADVQLKEIVFNTKTSFREKAEKLLVMLKEKFTQSLKIGNLITNLDSIDKIETIVKNLKAEGFKSFFNIPLLFGDVAKYLPEEITGMISGQLLDKENSLQLIIAEIKSTYQGSMKAFLRELTAFITPIKEQFEAAFAPERLEEMIAPLYQKLESTGQIISQLIDANFLLANNYVEEVIDSANTFGLSYTVYRTTGFKTKVNKGRNNLLLALNKIIKAVVEDFPSLLNEILVKVEEKIQELKDESILKFLSQFKEITFIDSFIEIVNQIGLKIRQIFESATMRLQDSVAAFVQSLSLHFNRKMEEFESNIRGFDWASERDDPCELLYSVNDGIGGSYVNCVVPTLKDNMDKFRSRFEYPSESQAAQEKFTFLIETQKNVVTGLVQGFFQTETKIKELLKQIVTDSPKLNSLLSSWKDMAVEFEQKYLNTNIKDKIFTNINTIIKAKAVEFIDYVKGNLNEGMQKYFDQFVAGISAFTSKPKEIPFRLNQVISFVAKDLLNIDEDIEQTLYKSLDYGLKYIYNLIGSKFDSFLDSFKTNFMGSLPPFIEGPITEKITALVSEIRNAFDSKLQVLLNVNNQGVRRLDTPVDMWKLKWISTEIQSNILPKFQTITNNIETEIKDKLANLADDFSTQSKKLDYSISNALQGTSSLFDIAKTALDSCLGEFKIGEFVESFKTMARSTIDYLKKELLSLNDRFKSIENIITSRFNMDIKSQIEDFFSIDKVNSFFKQFLEKALSVTLNAESIFSEIMSEFKQSLISNINAEVERIKQLAGSTSFKVMDNYFVTLYETLDKNLVEKMTSFVNTHLDELYQTLLSQIKARFKDRIDAFLNDIETRVNEHMNLFGLLDIINGKFDIKEGVKSAIAFAKNKFNEYYLKATEVIELQYILFKSKTQSISIEISNRLKGIFDWSKTNLLNKFEFTSGSAGKMLSQDFLTTITLDVTTLIDKSIQKIKDMDIVTTVTNNIKSIDLTISSVYCLSDIKQMFEGIILEVKEEIKKEILNQKNQITQYLQQQLSSQSMKSLSLLFNSGDFYKNLKEKCIDNNIKLAFNFINSKIQEMTSYSMFLLSDTLKLSSSVVNLVPLLVSGFTQQFQSVIQELLVGKINNKLKEFLVNTQGNVMSQFEGLMSNMLFDNQDLGNVASIIKEQITSFDKNTYKKSISDFYSNELVQAGSSFIKPMEGEIKQAIQVVQVKLKEQFDIIIADFKKKVIEQINEQLEAILGDTRGVIGKIGEAVDGKIMTYLMQPDKTVEGTLDIIIEKLMTSFGPITDIMNSIRNNIEEKVNLTLDKVEDFAFDVNNKLNTSVLVKITETKQKIISTLDTLKFTIINKVITFESEIFNWFFPKNNLRSLPAPDDENITNLRSTAFSFGVTEAKNALNMFQTSIESIKNSMKSLDITSQIQLAFEKYKDKILNGLGVMKKPVTLIINQIMTVFDEAFINRIENRIEATIIRIKDIGMSSINQVKKDITDVIFYFKEYPSSLIKDLVAAVKNQTDIELTNLIGRVLDKFKPAYLTQKKDYPPITLFKTIVSLFGLPLFFDLRFAYGYEYGLDIKVKDLTIYLSASCGGYAMIEGRAYLSVLVAEFGGKITGLLGRGRISIGPSFALTTFKVNLQASVFLQAFEFRAAVFATFPWITFEDQCKIIFVFKVCIKWPKLIKKTVEYGFSLYEGLKYKNQWDKLY